MSTTKPSWVRLDIGELCLEFSDHQDDVEAWCRSFVRSLARNDPSLNSFAAKLLGEASQYRQARINAAKTRWEEHNKNGKYKNQFDRAEELGDAVRDGRI